jgi:hypothetical protein
LRTFFTRQSKSPRVPIGTGHFYSFFPRVETPVAALIFPQQGFRLLS